MAIAEGTNAGFCAAQPSGDPEGNPSPVDGFQIALKHTSPADAFTITELGWWQDSASNDAANFSLGIYNNDAGGDSGNGIPTTLVSAQEAGISSASTVQWERVAKEITGLVTSTVYWIAIGCEAVSNANNYTYETRDARRHFKAVGGTPNWLTDPWGTSDGSSSTSIRTVYALYEAAGGEVISIVPQWRHYQKVRSN